jgi:hypothetical protein
MASPLVCVVGGHEGPVKRVRLAVDYRYLNKFSSGDAFPTPDLDDALERVSRARFISCFDAKSGFWQIPMDDSSIWLTAFVANGNLYEFTRMPFGLKCSGITFVRAMSVILQDITDFTEPFIDDMAVCSDVWSDHLKHLTAFFETIEQSGLTLNLQKCSFAQAKVVFVGHLVGSGNKAIDPNKISCLNQIVTPKTKKDVRKLLGFFSYFRLFVPNFAEIARILSDLTKNDKPHVVQWTTEHQVALDTLKDRLTNATQLHSVNFSKEFGILVDASLYAVGCCLIQWSEEGQELPLAFASLKLQPHQCRWSTIEREAFAVMWALRKFRRWVFWSKVTIFSDHNPLTYLTENISKSSKLTRWALALQEFDLQFKYRRGNQNVAADFLSRI